MSYKFRDGRERRFSVFFRWVLTLFTGFLTALAGIILLFCTQHVSQIKRHIMEHYLVSGPDSQTLVYGVVLGINVGLVAFAAILTIFVEPVAAGSGISEIKSMLNGLKIPRMLRFRTLCCKVIGTVCSVAGGLPVGKEGPMIHSGGIIAAGLSQGKSNALGYDT
ncbi:Chloride transport protein 6, partial [Aphanomyces cochlioides]